MAECVVMGAGGGKSEGKFAWKKNKIILIYESAYAGDVMSLGGYLANNPSEANDLVTIQYSSNYKINNDNSFTLINPSTIQSSYNLPKPAPMGVYCIINNDIKSLYFTTDVAIITGSSAEYLGTYYYKRQSAKRYIVGKSSSAVCVIDDDENKYPGDGNLNGEYYKRLV